MDSAPHALWQPGKRDVALKEREPVAIPISAEPFTFFPPNRPRAGAVLCHGFTGSPASMRPWGEHLRRNGIAVTAPLLPGHGTRWQDLNRTRWQDWYAALEDAFDTVRARVHPMPVFAMGLSMGGTLVTRLAERRGAQVAGLVLVNPSFMTQRRGARWTPLISRFVPSLAGIAGDTKKVTSEGGYDRMPLRAFNELRKLWRITRRNLATVTAPLLVFRSAVDHVVEPVSTQLLLAGVSSERVQEVVLHDSYHVATLDNDAPRIFAASVGFIGDHTHESARGTVTHDDR